MFKTLKIKSLFLFVAIIGSAGLCAQNAKISDNELNQFADAYVTMQAQNQEVEQEMITIIQNEGLKFDRFNEIHKASLVNQKTDATEAELKKHASALAKLEQKQPEWERKVKTGIESKGLTFERFQELTAIIQKDGSLQRRLNSITMKNRGE